MDANNPAVFTVALLLAALGLKLTDLAKAIVVLITCGGGPRRDALNDLISLLTSASLGVLFVQYALKNSAWGDEIKIGDETLGSLDFGSTVIFGLVFAALASTLHDFKKAVAKTSTNDLRFIK